MVSQNGIPAPMRTGRLLNVPYSTARRPYLEKHKFTAFALSFALGMIACLCVTAAGQSERHGKIHSSAVDSQSRAEPGISIYDATTSDSSSGVHEDEVFAHGKTPPIDLSGLDKPMDLRRHPTLTELGIRLQI